MQDAMKELSGWGRHPVVRGVERISEDLLAASGDVCLSRGLGRSYGDASLPADATHPVLGTRLADRILAFDPESGILRAEAGLSMERINALFTWRAASASTCARCVCAWPTDACWR
jgi:FAD/FMN-containing dehydrogenase